jgi:5'-phosphate synthase pdxT subunit
LRRGDGDRIMKIGVLALQGDFEEHCVTLKRLGIAVREVRVSEDLLELDGIIIPGGESTTIGKLAHDFGLEQPLRRASETVPIWGTCGGLIFMARDVGMEQPILGIMDVTVQRNAFGRQVDSFEEDLLITGIEGDPFPGIFIRAPVIKEVGPEVKILCRLADERIVAVRQGRLLGTSFHPELTGDDRVHRYFLRMAADRP